MTHIRGRWELLLGPATSIARDLLAMANWRWVNGRYRYFSTIPEMGVDGIWNNVGDDADTLWLCSGSNHKYGSRGKSEKLQLGNNLRRRYELNSGTKRVSGGITLGYEF